MVRGGSSELTSCGAGACSARADSRSSRIMLLYFRTCRELRAAVNKMPNNQGGLVPSNRGGGGAASLSHGGALRANTSTTSRQKYPLAPKTSHCTELKWIDDEIAGNNSRKEPDRKVLQKYRFLVKITFLHSTPTPLPVPDLIGMVFFILNFPGHLIKPSCDSSLPKSLPRSPGTYVSKTLSSLYEPATIFLQGQNTQQVTQVLERLS